MFQLWVMEQLVLVSPLEVYGPVAFAVCMSNSCDTVAFIQHNTKHQNIKNRFATHEELPEEKYTEYSQSMDIYLPTDDPLKQLLG